jgi:hypothetical protein
MAKTRRRTRVELATRYRVIVLGIASLSWGCRPVGSDEPPQPPAARGCTEIGCGPAFLVEFESRGDRNLGLYRVDLVIDGDAITCERQLPLHCDDPPACPRDDVQLIEIGCALGESEHALGGVQFVGATPRSISITVFENDVQIGAASYELAYATSHPNGPECDPACTQAPTQKLVLAGATSPSSP